MKKLISLLALFTSLLLGQFKDPALEKKFDSEVLREIKIIKQEKLKGNSIIEINRLLKTRSIGLDDKFRVLCRIRVIDLSVTLEIISIGGEIKYTTHNDLYAWIPIDEIERVAEIDGVLSIGSKGIVRSRSEVISAGVALHRTDLASSSFSTYGNGVKVGVISDGMNYWTNSSSNGDLPLSVFAVDNTDNTTNYPGREGTAMMEIIHDIAPYSELWFGGVNNNDTPLDFANRVTHLKQNGCKVIVDDKFFPEGYSFFQENEITTAILQFIQNNNGCYISAVGNEHGKMYTGVNYTVDADNFIKFNSSTKELTFTTNYNGEAEIFFQWADDWYSPVHDYDLYVFDNNNNILLTQEHRSPNFPPEEWGRINVSQGSTYKIKIKWYNYNLSLPVREIKVLILGDNIAMPLASNEKEVFGHLITNAVIGVAATDASSHTAVENFSSRGPAIAYSSVSGTYTSNQQPKITAADGVQTFVGQNGNFFNPFSGTSAAAPHIAGIAALYYSLFPNDSYTDFLDNIKAGATAFDGGNPQTWDRKSGYGLADAYKTMDIRMPNGVNIVQVDTSGQSFGTAAYYYLGAWQYKNPNETVPLQTSYYWNFKASQDFKSGTYLKYNRWERDNSVITDRLNYANILISTGEERLKAHFIPSYLSTVQNAFEGFTSSSGGAIEFKDPWLIDYYESSYGYRNQGTSAPFKSRTSPFSPDYTTSYSGDIYKGVFLNQSGPSNNWAPPYYAVRAQSTQTAMIGGVNRTLYFQNWSSNGATFQNPTSLETPVVFNSANAVVSPNYKATQLSSTSTAFQNGSQRKLVKTDNNYLYITYESMGHVWYEISTDNGLTWSLGNGGKPLDNGGGKLPSIASHVNDIGIVWEESDGGAVKIQIACGSGLSLYNGYPKNVFWDVTQSYSNDLNPVIAYDYNGRAVVTWENKVNYVYSAGIVARFGPLGQFSFLGSPTWDGWNTQVIPSTNSSSLHPTIASNKNPNDIYKMYYQIAWEQSSAIYYSRDSVDAYNVMHFSTVKNISTGSYPFSYNPSIIALADGSARVVWQGYYYPGSSAIAVYRDPSYNQFWYFGSNVRTPQITLADNNSNFYIIWIENLDNSTRFTDGHSLYTIYNLGITGQAVQLSNGTDRNSMYASVFTNTSLPYYFRTSASIGSVSLHKTSAAFNDKNIGRGGVVIEESVGIHFSIQKIQVDDQTIDFEPAPDTLNINNINQLNKYLISKPFALTDASNFFCSVRYGVTDSIKAKNILGVNSPVSYTLTLVDANTGQTIGNFNGVTFNNNNVPYYRNQSYQVVTKGIGGRQARLKLTVSLNNSAGSNVSADFALTSSYSDLGNTLLKSGMQQISYDGGDVIKSYSLEQNYPNPFNPTTKISFSLPQKSQIKLKVFDVLGREIQILADGIYEAGKYEVGFNASSAAGGLPSGIYFYNLITESNSITKKMLLVK